MSAICATCGVTAAALPAISGRCDLVMRGDLPEDPVPVNR
jgi:hypothetical protein